MSNILIAGADRANAARVVSGKLLAPRRILFIDHTASLGGGEIALFNLVRQLNRKRYEPVVLLCSDGPLTEQLREAGIETHVLTLDARVAHTRKDSLGWRSVLRLREVFATLAYVVRMVRLIQRLNVDLVHTNSLKADVMGGIAARLAWRPLLWHVRDRIDEDYLPRAVVRIFRLMARMLPTYVIANSAATLKTLHLSGLSRGQAIASGLDLTSNSVSLKMRVVHDGMEGGSVCAGGDDGRVAPVIGLVGRITRWKGQHVFIKSAAMVLERFPHARFQIIGAALFGEADYEREVRELASQVSPPGSIEFTGFRSDVQTLIAKLNVLVHASITGEPFGQVVIEGMAAGKPVVATDGGGVPEIVEDGVTGLLVPMGDSVAMAAAICRVLADPKAGQEMGRLGRQRVLDHFTIDQTARQVERLYDEMLGQPGSNRPLAARRSVNGRA